MDTSAVLVLPRPAGLLSLLGLGLLTKIKPDRHSQNIRIIRAKIEIHEYGVAPVARNKMVNGKKHKLEKKRPTMEAHLTRTILRRR